MVAEGVKDGLCRGVDCPDAVRVPITLTYVLYNQGDMIGMLLAWMSLLPIFILVGFVTLIAFRRDLHTIFFFWGVLFNEGFNYLLKHIIKDPRPDLDLLQKDSLFMEYGMPSSHSQFMAFFAIYFTLFVFVRVMLSAGIFDYIWKVLTSSLAIMAAVGSSAGRIYLGYHSMAQVICGAATGSVLGVVWFLIVHHLISPSFPIIFSWRISEVLLLKDVSNIPNYLWFEYTSARVETRKRIRTKSK